MPAAALLGGSWGDAEGERRPAVRTPDQTATLRHLVEIEPVSRNARYVRRRLSLDVSAAVLSARGSENREGAGVIRARSAV